MDGMGDDLDEAPKDPANDSPRLIKLEIQVQGTAKLARRSEWTCSMFTVNFSDIGEVVIFPKIHYRAKLSMSE
eukprot:scaffold35423_cov35-Prasinocladus_malaysianus.AAC.2